MREVVEVLLTSAFWGCLQYKDIVIEHDFTLVESDQCTVHLGNSLSQRAGLVVDQQGPHVYLVRELKAVGLITLCWL